MLSKRNEFMTADQMAKALLDDTVQSKQTSYPATISRAERNRRKKRERMKKHSRVINRY